MKRLAEMILHVYEVEEGFLYYDMVTVSCEKPALGSI